MMGDECFGISDFYRIMVKRHTSVVRGAKKGGFRSTTAGSKCRKR